MNTEARLLTQAIEVGWVVGGKPTPGHVHPPGLGTRVLLVPVPLTFRLPGYAPMAKQ